jgi:hypothetical protein
MSSKCTQHLYMALADACAGGHVEIVTWLLGEMKLSHDERVRWLLATLHGGVNIVRLLAERVGFNCQLKL